MDKNLKKCNKFLQLKMTQIDMPNTSCKLKNAVLFYPNFKEHLIINFHR